MSFISVKKGSKTRVLSTFAECWIGAGIMIGGWALMYFLMMYATGNIK